MAAADFIARCEIDPRDKRALRTKLVELSEEMKDRKCIWLRSSIDPQTNTLYMEGWRTIPIDQGPVPWQIRR